ncbi:Putative uncharacterized protein [Lactobacillus helveticus CIRM-BIA 951]|uniref:Uncharacterized protein n=1 Tax=Lactobacillus helveticus CIRM-BIA 951 TaxID=1226334 RepID=U6F5X3_LACHE|nr:hypothetical protein [Lactobacillus helveticus]NRO48753.1 hypothetical protein [Lactobacillus helveticus]CDI59361.1 Putative uncharacterized protein [Lactobacillus helveticus CIRM-BIA 951]
MVNKQCLIKTCLIHDSCKRTTIDVFVRELGAKSFPDIEQLGQKVVDNFVKKETNFNSWEEMQQRAVSEYMSSLF